MDAVQKVFDAIKTILGYLKAFIDEILAAAGIQKEEVEAPAEQ